MDRPKRVLIDWDWEANGIWLISVRNEASAPVPEIEDVNSPRFVSDQPLSNILSSDLVHDLHSWNDAADTLYGARAFPTHDDIEGFWAMGRQLAERAQEELGPKWEVLYNPGPAPGAWAWTWVRQPRAWQETGSDKANG